ncbi:MAG: rod shape-determining protein MreC [Gemmatimonadales bacterium]
MTIGTERYGSRADTAVFVVCLVLSLVALALPEALRLPVASALRRTVLLPVVTAERQAALSREERQDVLALREERDSLALAAALLPDLRSENAQLRALLRLSGRLGYGYVSAEVMHQTGMTDALTLLLSSGRSEGVEPLAPVVAPAGLVGSVLSVDAHTSVAMAWSHPDFRVGAMVDGGRIFGIVAARRGETAGEVMELRGIAYRENLPIGTPVVTSGLGGVFPRGIPIGTVQGVLSETAGWERTYLLKPAVHPAQASHVMVLSLERAADTLTAAFDTLPAPSDSGVKP